MLDYIQQLDAKLLQPEKPHDQAPGSKVIAEHGAPEVYQNLVVHAAAGAEM